MWLLGIIIGKLKRFFIFFSVLNFLFFKSLSLENQQKNKILWQKKLLRRLLSP